MWETPIAQAKHAIQIKEKEQEIKSQVSDSSKKVFLDSTSDCPVSCFWTPPALRDFVLSVIPYSLCTVSFSTGSFFSTYKHFSFLPSPKSFFYPSSHLSFIAKLLRRVIIYIFINHSLVLITSSIGLLIFHQSTEIK